MTFKTRNRKYVPRYKSHFSYIDRDLELIRYAVAEAMMHRDFSDKEYTVNDVILVARRIKAVCQRRKLKIVENE